MVLKVEFYELLGLAKIDQLVIMHEGFYSIYMTYDQPDSPSSGLHDADRSGVTELMHHYGTETDEGCKVLKWKREPYIGYGHVSILVENVEALCQKLKGGRCLIPETSRRCPALTNSNNLRRLWILRPIGQQIYPIPAKWM